MLAWGLPPSAVTAARVGTAALGRPAGQSPACVCTVKEWRFVSTNCTKLHKGLKTARPFRVSHRVQKLERA